MFEIFVLFMIVFFATYSSGLFIGMALLEYDSFGDEEYMRLLLSSVGGQETPTAVTTQLYQVTYI